MPISNDGVRRIPDRNAETVSRTRRARPSPGAAPDRRRNRSADRREPRPDSGSDEPTGHDPDDPKGAKIDIRA